MPTSRRATAVTAPAALFQHAVGTLPAWTGVALAQAAGAAVPLSWPRSRG